MLPQEKSGQFEEKIWRYHFLCCADSKEELTSEINVSDMQFGQGQTVGAYASFDLSTVPPWITKLLHELENWWSHWSSCRQMLACEVIDNLKSKDDLNSSEQISHSLPFIFQSFYLDFLCVNSAVSATLISSFDFESSSVLVAWSFLKIALLRPAPLRPYLACFDSQTIFQSLLFKFLFANAPIPIA